MKYLHILLASCLLFTSLAKAQNDTIIFNKVSEFEYSWTYSAYTALFDNDGRPYVYTASMELGLVTFDISDINNPVPTDTIMPAGFNGGKLTNIYQHGDYLYGSLGGFQGLTPQNLGLVILDITDPEDPQITDLWDSTAYNQGAAIAISDGNYAYVGGMDTGIVILDVQDKNNIKFQSKLRPHKNFPQVPGLFSVPNARGLDIRNDTLFVANDAGGLRMIDVSDKQNPVEIGKYVNQSLFSVAQPAYNNVEVVDGYAYIPVDYCGLDVVNITDTAMYTEHWYDPWGCNATNWDGRPGHTNQLVNLGDSLLFVSGGDIEVLVFDINDKANPLHIGTFGVDKDSAVSWGLDVLGDKVVLAQVDNPLGVPYDSDWGGIVILEWATDTTGSSSSSIITTGKTDEINIFPNPSSTILSVKSKSNVEYFNVLNINGKALIRSDRKNSVDISHLSPGMYFVEVRTNGQVSTLKFVKE